VAGLDVGADDYLASPLTWPSCWRGCARLLRRHNLIEGMVRYCAFEDLSLNPQTAKFHRGPRSVELTKIEFDLLECFTSPTTGATRDQISTSSGYNFDSGTNSLAVYIGILAASSKRRTKCD